MDKPVRVKRQHTKNKQLPCVKVDEAMESALVAACNALDVSMSEGVRLAIEHWLAAQNGCPKASPSAIVA
jgi:hypothetical protein